MNDLIIYLVVGFFLVLLGILFVNRKCLFLVAGFSTLSADETSKIDKNKTGKYVGIYLLLIGVLIIASGFLITFLPDIKNTFIIIMAILMVLSAFALIIIVNTGNRMIKK